MHKICFKCVIGPRVLNFMSYFIQNDFEDLILLVAKKPLLSFLFV
jgi:hypothetical protein